MLESTLKLTITNTHHIRMAASSGSTKSKTKGFKVPFDKNGNQMTWEGWSMASQEEPFEFGAELKYVGFSRGRSALNIKWLDLATNKIYQSGMSLLDDHLKRGGGCTITGKFGFKKQGTAILLTCIQWK
jgi:hypothetical protein